MRRLPDRAHLDHLKKQAKDLLRAYRAGAPEAFATLRAALPAAAGRDDAALAAMELRLHDMQSAVAREYGFASWNDLSRYVEVQASARPDRAALVLRWLGLVYGSELVDDGIYRASPRVAVRVLDEHPDLLGDDPYLACAVGDEDALRRATAADPAWLNRAGGPLHLLPLVAVTHSSLLWLEAYRNKLHRCARFLLDAGAAANQLFTTKDGHALSALYGAVKHGDAVLTRMLLEAGADPNDGESLYHSLGTDEVTRVLLEHGAHAAGSNAIYHALDHPDVTPLALLLGHGADPNEPARNEPITQWGSPLLWGIKRRRSRAHAEALLDAGADASKRTPDGTSAYSLAMQFGLDDVAALLRERGAPDAAPDALSEAESFVAACARGDVAEAHRIRTRRPDLPGALSEHQLRVLPELVAGGNDLGVRTMIELGWPIAVRGGDFEASALNHAVFRGDPALTRFLLDHGAHWTEPHAYGDDVIGTLSWASRNLPANAGDWPGCARVLLDCGLAHARHDPEAPGALVVDGRRMYFSDEVAEVLLT
ncbi:MAG: hypothetical protein JOZ86_00855 [Candidatus Eremiobacteraeota bacterium]|nr:hypothetical protein [Candidatus Eremiobacteraeota bacterium]